MSFQVTTAMVQQYNANISLLSQQKQSRLEPYCRKERIHAEYEYFDRIGPVEAQPKGARHSDTPLMSTPHSRRRVQAIPYNWADMVDTADKLRMITDPTSPYAVNAVMGFNRAKDRALIDAAFGTVQAGKEGQISVPFPATQVVPPVNVGLTLAKLMDARQMLWEAEVDDAIPLIAVVTAEQLKNLLQTTEVVDADYTTVKALVKGEVDTFMGFKFVRTQLLPINAGIRDCLFYAADGLIMAVSEDISVKVTERADKNYSTQVYVEMDLGAVRMEEVKVIKVQCKEGV